jgi:hypothetical protein
MACKSTKSGRCKKISQEFSKSLQEMAERFVGFVCAIYSDIYKKQRLHDAKEFYLEPGNRTQKRTTLLRDVLPTDSYRWEGMAAWEMVEYEGAQ